MTSLILQAKLDAILNVHMNAELAGDLDLTISTISSNQHIINVPTMIGGQGIKGVRKFYSTRLLGQFFPPDVKFENVSRTYSEDRLVVELIISFTHNIKMDHILPGTEPIGKFVEAVFVVIIGIENDKVSYEHILWDQAIVLVHVGLLDPKDLPVVGAGAAEKLINPGLPDTFFKEEQLLF